MPNQFTFACPNCGSNTVEPRTEPKTYSDLLGCSCATCGHIITDNDIARYGRKVQDEVIRKLGIKKPPKID